MAERADRDGGLAEEKAALRAAMKAARAGIPTAERKRLAAAVCARVLALPEVQAARTVAVYCAHGTELALGALVRGLCDRGGVQLVAPVTLTGRRLAFVLVEAVELLACGEEPVIGREPLAFSTVPATATEEPAIGKEPLAPSMGLGAATGKPATNDGKSLESVRDSEAQADGRRPAFLAHPERPVPAVPVGRIAVAPEGIDVMLVPGLAFDERGMRLGYGAGYYDAWLDRAARRTICESELACRDECNKGASWPSRHSITPDATESDHVGKTRITANHQVRPLTVGICFDEQLVPRVPAEPHDQPVAVVATPGALRRLHA